jgi:hypothetical protein
MSSTTKRLRGNRALQVHGRHVSARLARSAHTLADPYKGKCRIPGGMCKSLIEPCFARMRIIRSSAAARIAGMHPNLSVGCSAALSPAARHSAKAGHNPKNVFAVFYTCPGQSGTSLTVD